MECIHKRYRRSKIDQRWYAYRCSKCLPCRVRKQSVWELRNHLEYRTSLSSSFLTLTIAPSEMDNWASRQPGDWVRLFFDALRASERRHGNKTMIRFFGCLEFGETFERPHYHMLVYNQAFTHLKPIPRKNGLPSSLYESPLWPHGHIDAGTVTSASIRYCASYLTKESAIKNTLYRTTRPGIGAYGLYRLAEQAVAMAGPSLPMPAYFQLGERKYPLDDFCRKHFNLGVKQAGGQLTLPHPDEVVLFRVQEEAAKALANHPQTNAEAIKAMEEKLAHVETKRQTRQAEILYRAANLSADKNLTSRTAPAHFDKGH